MSESGGGSVIRPVSRSRSASRFGRQQQQTERADEGAQLHATEDLGVRVKERDPSAATGAETTSGERPRSRLSTLFKSADPTMSPATMASGAGGIEQKASELKETLTRPLSSLFRRSQSHGERSAAGGGIHQQQSLAAGTSAPPQRAPPAARGPIAASARAVAANGAPSVSAASVSTTTIRPFSGFPGKRAPAPQPPATDQSATATNNFGTDLSEQAAQAPHVNLRRFSGLLQSADFVAGHHGGGKGSGRGRAAEIDVNFLSRFLCPEDESNDEQVPWTWDSLFASVSSELREEWALEEEANNDVTAVATGGEGIGVIPNGLQQNRGM